MASTTISDDAAKPLRSTAYDAIPITNTHSDDMRMLNDDSQSFLRRTVPMRTAIVVALLLAFSCGLIGRESVKWSYNRTKRNLSNLMDTRLFSEHGGVYVAKKSSMTRATNIGQVTRKGTTYLTGPSGTKDITRFDGTHIVVSIYNVPEGDISAGESIMAVGTCPKEKQVTSCMCTTTARDCLEAGSGKVDKGGNGCQCDYTGISSVCRHAHSEGQDHHDHGHNHHDHPHPHPGKQTRVFVISYCV